MHSLSHECKSLLKKQTHVFVSFFFFFLINNRTYYFCFLAQNDIGTKWRVDVVFVSIEDSV